MTILMSCSGHSLCKSEWVSKLDPIMAGLGARKPHLAPLLAWAVLHLRATADQASTSTSSSSAASTRTYHRLAERALGGNVFSYLQTALTCAPIQVRPQLECITHLLVKTPMTGMAPLSAWLKIKGLVCKVFGQHSPLFYASNIKTVQRERIFF